jgi:hypothetical protein
MLTASRPFTRRDVENKERGIDTTVTECAYESPRHAIKLTVHRVHPDKAVRFRQFIRTAQRGVGAVWKECAKQIVKEMVAWVDANREAILARRPG